MKTIPGAKVENNKFCVSVHYRCVEEKVPFSLSSVVLLICELSPFVETNIN